MSAYLVATVRVTDPEGFRQYPPAVIPLIEAHGGEVLAADFAAEALEGEAPPVAVVIRFPSKAALRAWYESPEYQAVKPLRHDHSTDARLVIVDAAAPPG